jgi:uncharacterized protein (TIGR02453 family)
MQRSESLDFLAELAANNHKDWMDTQRARYQATRAGFLLLVEELLGELQERDESLRSLEAKACLYRQNRDLRFSKDKSPYNPWLSAFMAEGGRHAEQAGYYIRLQPGNQSVVGGGLYCPSPDQLRKMRQEIDYNAAELKQITNAKDFKSYFVAIQGDMLSRPPKGYPADHPNLNLLKLKEYFALRRFTDEEVCSGNFIEEVKKTFLALEPFITFLNVAIS